MNISRSVGFTINNMKIGVRQHSPEILLVGGIVGGIISAILACKSTRKLDDVLDDIREDLDEIHEEEQDLREENGGELSNREIRRFKQRITKTYVKLALKLVRLYAIPFLVALLSILSLLGSHNILQKRNLALAATVSSLTADFEKYRDRVKELFGEEIDKKILLGSEEVEVEEIDEDGKVAKKKVEVVNPENSNSQVRFFTRHNPYWNDDENYLRMFFNQRQSYLNDELIATNGKYPIVLNKAWDSFGFDPTDEGGFLGWEYDPKNPMIDSYIQARITKVKLPGDNGDYEDAYAIDFNYDGVVNKIVKKMLSERKG